ncbi:50S ribosomal protein L33 [Trueperella pyogenes]|uniref:50S ribosomal protein L33 n=1 Tax=Trueperella pyogenes TaxID=1661 RepID=UPI00345D31A7
MAKGQDIRKKVILESTAGTHFRYITTKNRRTNPERMHIKKYDPLAKAHVEFVEKN